MKRAIAIFLALCVLCLTTGASWQAVLTGIVSSSAPSYDFEENFETATTGYDNSGWTTANSASPAYSTSPAPLQGTQSLHCASGAIRGANKAATGLTGEVWYYWQMYCVTGAVNDYHVYGDYAETSFRVGISGGNIRLVIAGSASVAGSAFPLDQLVHVWVRYQPGAGTANGDLYYSTTGTRGSAQCSLTSKNTTTEAASPKFRNVNTYAVIYDRIIISSTEIGDNP